MNFLMFGPGAPRHFRFTTTSSKLMRNSVQEAGYNDLVQTANKNWPKARANANGHQLPRQEKLIYRLPNCTCYKM
jgi:hypothetical protein